MDSPGRAVDDLHVFIRSFLSERIRQTSKGRPAHAETSSFSHPVNRGARLTVFHTSSPVTSNESIRQPPSPSPHLLDAETLRLYVRFDRSEKRNVSVRVFCRKPPRNTFSLSCHLLFKFLLFLFIYIYFLRPVFVVFISE